MDIIYYRCPLRISNPDEIASASVDEQAGFMILELNKPPTDIDTARKLANEVRRRWCDKCPLKKAGQAKSTEACTSRGMSNESIVYIPRIRCMPPDV